MPFRPDPGAGAVEATEEIRDRTGTQRLVGYVLDRDPATGTARCWLDLGPQHRNSQDLLHGGLAATLLDVACGNAAGLHFDSADPPMVLTLSLTLSYVRSIREGRITATGRASGGGRSIAYAAGELRGPEGQVIATAAGVFKRVRSGGAT